MGNHLRRHTDAEHPGVRPRKKPKGRWPFWRIVYWVAISMLVLGLITAMYLTLQSDFGECSSYDVRCD